MRAVDGGGGLVALREVGGLVGLGVVFGDGVLFGAGGLVCDDVVGGYQIGVGAAVAAGGCLASVLAAPLIPGPSPRGGEGGREPR